MKEFISLRHGRYNHGHGDLSKAGHYEAKVLVKTLKEILTGEKTGMYSSSAKVTEQFSNEIASAFKIKPVFDKYLSVENGDHVDHYYSGKPRRDQKALRLINKQGKDLDSLILITHCCVAEPLANIFLRQIGAPEIDYKTGADTFDTASGIYINLENKTYKRI